MDSNGLVYLRARYYAPSLGAFIGLDPLEGDASNPISLNRYMWVKGNVVNTIDPSGLAPIISGYIEGGSVTASAGLGSSLVREIVYNFSTFQRLAFKVNFGENFVASSSVGGVSGSLYFGHVEGFTRNPKGGYIYVPSSISGHEYLPDNPYELFEHFKRQYSGAFIFEQGGLGFKIPMLPGITAGIIHFHSVDNSIYGNNVYISGGWSLASIPGIEISGGVTIGREEEIDFFSGRIVRKNYMKGCYVDRNELVKDIILGEGSTHNLRGLPIGIPIISQQYRGLAAVAAGLAADEWNNQVVCPPVGGACTGAPIPLIPPTAHP